MAAMPWAAHPSDPGPHPADVVADLLDPVLGPLGFAPGQLGAAGAHGQVIFCRGDAEGADGGCVDLVVELEEAPQWRIVDVRYWGLPSDRWHLDLDRDAPLVQQLAGLAATLPPALS